MSKAEIDNPKCVSCVHSIFDELWGEFKCKKREHTIYNLTSYFSCEYYEKKDEEFINGQ